jgi:hypothetical protein
MCPMGNLLASSSGPPLSEDWPLIKSIQAVCQNPNHPLLLELYINVSKNIVGKAYCSIG